MALPSYATWRALYAASNNKLYGVNGQHVVYIDASWNVTVLGTLQGQLNTPVSISDNSITAVLVDGSPLGYQIDLATNVFSQITDTNFLGATRIDFVDTFFVSNVPGTQEFQTSFSNEAVWDALQFASKTGASDMLVSLIVLKREVWLLGQDTGEVWYDAGGAIFPLAILPGVFLTHGTLAPYSLAKQNDVCFWLSQSNQGTAQVFKGQAYADKRISTYAIENEIASYTYTADAIGMTYQQQGHTFYVLTFPTANKTWVWDEEAKLWHQRTWTDPDGGEHRWRPNCLAFCYGMVIAGDWQNGNLYQVNPDDYTDAGQPIVRKRSFPHLVNEGKRVQYTQFSADMECGTFDPAGDQDTSISLRWSDDRGKSWSNAVIQSLGQGGQYLTQPKWSRLGMARDRVFELSWSVAAKTALNGAYIDVNSFGS